MPAVSAPLVARGRVCGGEGGRGEGRVGGASSEAIVAAGGNMVPHVRLM